MRIGDRIVFVGPPHILKIGTLGTVCRPGISRGGLYVRVEVDGMKKTFAADFWKVIRK